MPVIRKKPGQRPIFPDVPIYLDVGEEGAQRGGVVAPVLFVVSPDLEVAGFGRVRVVEAAEQVVDGGVGDVGEALLQVVFQGALVDEEIASEFIAGGAVAPVAVGQDDEAGIFMERDHDGDSRTPDYAGPGFKGHAGQPAFANI